MILPSLATIAARLEADLAAETAKIDAAIAAKQITDGTNYWKHREALRRRLAVVRAMQEAVEEGL